MHDCMCTFCVTHSQQKRLLFAGWSTTGFSISVASRRCSSLLAAAAAAMASKKGPFFYAVAKGKKVGVYSTWGECEQQV